MTEGVNIELSTGRWSCRLCPIVQWKSRDQPLRLNEGIDWSSGVRIERRANNKASSVGVVVVPFALGSLNDFIEHFETPAS